jgi:thioredoxin reductase (NADPH)
VVTHEKLVVRQEEPVASVEAAVDGFRIESAPVQRARRVTRARAVIIATGYFGTPNRVGVPGEDLPHVTHWFRDGHDAFQRSAVVVGGGNSAAEVALDLFRVGARVTLVHFGPTFDKVIKPWVLSDLEGRLRDGSIDVRWNTTVAAITPADVTLRSASGESVVAADRVYLMTGFTPSSSLLAPLGIPVDPVTGVPSHDPATMETPVRDVYIAGVLASGNDANRIFIENGRDHGALIARTLAARWRS